MATHSLRDVSFLMIFSFVVSFRMITFAGMKTKEIQIQDYSYALPDERIAKFPIAERDHSKLLIYNKGEVGEDVFYHLPEHLPQGALMVFNNTKVIQARLHFRKETGALIEIFLLEPAKPADYEQMFQTRDCCQWLCIPQQNAGYQRKADDHYGYSQGRGRNESTH